MNYPRDVAVRVLTRVLSDNEALDAALAAVSGELNPETAGWLQEVTSGTLRWKGRLDRIIDSIALKKKPSGWLRKVLLIGAYQLVVQERTSPGAVVSETVAEVKRKEGDAPAKFANALLRKISDHGAKWREQVFPAKAPEIEMAAWASLPEWLWWKLQKQHGREWAAAFSQASLERPKLWIRPRHEKWTQDSHPEWVTAGPLPGVWQVTEGGSIVNKPGFREGEFLVQDISNQLLISEIVAEVRKVSRAETALDLCAAPGGKSVGMAWSGFKVVATDANEARVALLKQTVERLAPEVQIVPRDGVAAAGPYDLVWVDSPCSGTGILRRHPDVRWLRREQELKGLQELQQKLLLEAWELVRPGGHLAYSVCSVLKDEGSEPIKKAGLAEKLVKEWTLAPHIAPFGDGFWAGLLKK